MPEVGELIELLSPSGRCGWPLFGLLRGWRWNKTIQKLPKAARYRPQWLVSGTFQKNLATLVFYREKQFRIFLCAGEEYAERAPATPFGERVTHEILGEAGDVFVIPQEKEAYVSLWRLCFQTTGPIPTVVGFQIGMDFQFERSFDSGEVAGCYWVNTFERSPDDPVVPIGVSIRLADLAG